MLVERPGGCHAFFSFFSRNAAPDWTLRGGRRETRAVSLRLRFERCLQVRRARRLAENCRAAVLIPDRILPTGVRDHFANQATARIVLCRLSFDRSNEDNRRTKKNTGGKRLRAQAIHRRLLPAGGNGGQSRPASTRAQWRQSF